MSNHAACEQGWDFNLQFQHNLIAILPLYQLLPIL